MEKLEVIKSQHNRLPNIEMEELSEILFKFIGFSKRERKRGVYILDDKLNDD